jgi:hypothetical protein
MKHAVPYASITAGPHKLAVSSDATWLTWSEGLQLLGRQRSTQPVGVTEQRSVCKLLTAVLTCQHNQCIDLHMMAWVEDMLGLSIKTPASSATCVRALYITGGH